MLALNRKYIVTRRNANAIYPKTDAFAQGTQQQADVRRPVGRRGQEPANGADGQGKKYPHAKYYGVEIPFLKVHQNIIDVGKPMDPSKAFEMKDYGKFMNTPGYCEVENGYCVLPSGVTYAAMHLKQPGRTDEMVQYYNQNFAPEDGLFYKIWCPGYHFIHYVNSCVENFGFGQLNMKFAGGVEIEDLGLNFEEIAKNDPACIAICGTTTAASRNARMKGI